MATSSDSGSDPAPGSSGQPEGGGSQRGAGGGPPGARRPGPRKGPPTGQTERFAAAPGEQPPGQTGQLKRPPAGPGASGPAVRPPVDRGSTGRFAAAPGASGAVARPPVDGGGTGRFAAAPGPSGAGARPPVDGGGTGRFAAAPGASGVAGRPAVDGGGTGRFAAAPGASGVAGRPAVDGGGTGRFAAAPGASGVTPRPPVDPGGTGRFAAAPGASGPATRPPGDLFDGAATVRVAPPPGAEGETPEQRTARVRRMRALGLVGGDPAASGPRPAREAGDREADAPPAAAPAPRLRRAPPGVQVPNVVLEALVHRADDGSAVHAGRQVEPDRQVTVHVLPPRALAGGRAEALARAAALLADVEHPGLVRVFACERLADGGLALVTERLDGTTLRDLAPAGVAMPPDAAASIVRQVAAGLAEAHRRGALHGGLTPEAVVMAPGPRLAVGGFGLARAPSPLAARDPDLTAARYQAPEQVDAGPVVDARADVHALGAIAYELLTGAPAFEGATAAAALTAVVRGEVVAPRARAPEVPPALSDLVVRMLARDPAARPASLDEVLRALDGAGSPAPTQPSPASPLALGEAPSLRPSPPRELAGALAALLALAAALGLVAAAASRDLGAAQVAPDPMPADVAADRALHRARAETAARSPERLRALERLVEARAGTPAAAAADAELRQEAQAVAEERASRRQVILAEAARRQRDGRLGPALDSLAEAASLADGDDAELAALREAIHGELAARGVAWVPAGAARLGERAAARSVWVKEVYVDVHEVTHEGYARFVATGGARPLATWGGPTPPPELAPLPVTGVTPRQAAAFAAWRGGRLPTPAEWEKAARGPGGATWPWGDEPDPAACNWAGAGHGRPLLPGAMPRDASPYGVLDLAGNVAELALDGTGAAAAEVRGGSFLTRWLPSTRAAFAQELPMDEAHPAVGFRCVHDAPPERSR